MIIKESVRSLIEFVYRQGDIDQRVGLSMEEGIRIHQMLQEKYQYFTAEVSLSQNYALTDTITLSLSGRADGIKVEGDTVFVDEIKSTFSQVVESEGDFSKLHWYQGMLYGAIYATQNDCDEIVVQLTYYALATESITRFKRQFNLAELGEFINRTLALYKPWALLHLALDNDCQKAAKLLKFPHGNYRKGQSLMAKAVYTSIRDAHNTVIEAPTGIGKTMATIYPAVKAIGEGHIQKIFYLTAKTIQREVALNAFLQLESKAFKMLVVAIRAKEKMCINAVFSCRPDNCDCAKGHYDRINDALYDFLKNSGVVTSETIIDYCKAKKLCPYEFSLDITNFAQAIICDYNYLFDPFVKLKRHFLKKNSYVGLVDEVHNLHDRARAMYSETLDIKQIVEMARHARDKDALYSKKLSKLHMTLKNQLKTPRVDILPESTHFELKSVIAYFLDDARYSGAAEDDKLLRHFFGLFRFYKLYDYYDESFALLYSNTDHTLSLCCLDASNMLKQSYGYLKSVICFSATLSPMAYYVALLGLKEAKRLQLDSPFDSKKCKKIVLYGHSTYAVDRLATLNDIVDDCMAIFRDYHGNFMVFCPSYTYLAEFEVALIERGLKEQLLVQKPNMTETERTAFLTFFEKKSQSNIIGLTVLGGAFSEAVDLPGNALSGVIIIGVGLSKLTPESDAVKAYYDKRGQSGFEYAYGFPGLNKVFQSAGRLIRTEQDEGVLVIIGKRFAQKRYLKEFPRHWNNIIWLRRYK